MPGPPSTYQVTLPYTVPTTRTQVTYELDDVADQLPTNGQVQVYDAARHLYVPRALVLDDLSDAVITSPATGAVLYYDGTNWIDRTPVIDDNTDVTLTSPAVRDLLVYDGTQWVNGTMVWQAFTPNIKLGVGTVAIANNDSRYTRVGYWVIAEYRFRFANLLGAIGTLTLDYPVLPRTMATYSQQAMPRGDAALSDISPAARYYGHAQVDTTTTWRITDGVGAGGSGTIFWTDTAPITINPGGAGTGDEFFAQIMYEAA